MPVGWRRRKIHCGLWERSLSPPCLRGRWPEAPGIRFHKTELSPKAAPHTVPTVEPHTLARGGAFVVTLFHAVSLWLVNLARVTEEGGFETVQRVGARLLRSHSGAAHALACE